MIFQSSIEQKLGLKFYSGGGGSSSGKTTPQLTPQQLVQLYNQTLPSTILNAAATVPSTTDLMAAGAASANPIYTASGLQQLGAYAPAYAQVGNQIAGQNMYGTAANLAGPGALLANIAGNLSNYYNPAQAAANNQAANLVNSIDLNGLSGGEQSAVERSLNQSNYATGNLGLDNATNLVSNAMNFGNALQAKRAALGSALGVATGVSGQQNTNFNPISTAMQSANPSSNFGLTNFNPTQANSSLTTPFSFASSFGNQLAGIGSASKGTTTSSNAYGGCFLTTACCEYKGLPDDCEELTILRQFRDKHVPQHLIDEYYSIAPIIAEKVKNDPNALEYIWENIHQCIQQIRDGCYTNAIQTYKNMVNELKSCLQMI